MNVQDFSVGLGKIDYDLSIVANWEHLLPGEPLKFRRMEVPDYMDDDEIQALAITDEKHLDMPFYWSLKINLSHQCKQLQIENKTKQNHSYFCSISEPIPIRQKTSLVQAHSRRRIRSVRSRRRTRQSNQSFQRFRL